MTELLAYADRISVAGGDRVAIKVSSIGADRYDAELLRLLSPSAGPNAPPFRTKRVETDANGTHEGRRQNIHRGSYGVIGTGDRLDSLTSFTLQAYVQPTRLAAGAQAILGCWVVSIGAGFMLALDEIGAASIRIGDGGGDVVTCTTRVPLLERCWYLLGASFDADSGRLWVFQEPVAGNRFEPSRAAYAEADCQILPKTAWPALILAAAQRDAGEPVPARMCTHFNGRIARPRLADRALDRDKVRALAAHTPPDDLAAAVVGAWDLGSETASSAFLDSSPRGLAGRLVNMPLRAVRGPAWSGSTWDWKQAPDEYDAVHFHDDDLADAGWETDFEIALPDDLDSGVYAVRLSAGEAEFFVPLFARPARGAAHADIAFLASTATYTVYANARGRFSRFTELAQQRLTVIDQTDLSILQHPELGLSGYDSHSDGSGVHYTTRLQPIVNSRPSGRLWNLATDMFIVDWLDRIGHSFDVITDEDLHRDGAGLLDRYRVLVTGSHPEYVTTPMFESIGTWLREGGRLMYMGGNGFYWRCAYSQEVPGVIEVRRAENGIRTWTEEAGESYHGFTGEYGGLWRNLGWPPNALVGVGFISNGFDSSSYYRRTGASQDPRVGFMFRGVDVEILGDAGLMMGGAAGYELDCADFALGTPGHALVVARSEAHSNNYQLVTEEFGIVQCALDATQDDRIRADMVFFETPGGGAVFSTGSIAYAGSIAVNDYDNPLARLTGNVLSRFAEAEPFSFPS